MEGSTRGGEGSGKGEWGTEQRMVELGDRRPCGDHNFAS